MAAQGEAVEIGLGGGHHQGPLGGIAQDLPAAVRLLLELGVAAEDTGLQQQIPAPRRQAAGGTGRGGQVGGAELAPGVVAVAAHRQGRGAAAQFLHHLAVEGEGAGLVGADHRHRAQGLHRRQAADQGGALHHPLGADRQGHGDHRRQALRHDRHRHRQAHLQQIEQALAQQPAEGHHHGHQGEGGAHQHVGQAIEPLLQRGGFPSRRVDHLGDLAQFGLHARGGDHRLAATAHHLGALEQAVQTLQHRGGGFQHQGGLLGHRLRFSGEGRLPQAQLGHLQQAGIGGHPIARLHPDQVAGHQLLARQPLPDAVTAHGHQGLGHVAQGLQCLLGPAFLQVAQQGVEPHDQHDGDRILGEPLGGESHRGGHGRHRQQHDQHHVAELVPEDAQIAAPRLELQPVRPQPGHPFGALGRGQPLGTGLQALKALFRGQGVPGGR